MIKQTFQRAELRNANDEIIQEGAYGKHSPLVNATNDAWIDYVMNNLEFLNEMTQAEFVPVTTLPEAGDTSKIYLVTTGVNAGKLYIWTGTEWQEQSNAEVVTRAEEAVNEAAALLAQVQALIVAATVNTEWDAETTYEVGDVVITSDGATYRCIQESTNNPPATSPGYWAAVMIVEAKTFEYDSNGDICPCISPVESANWGIDSNGDIYPSGE